jgi:predicted Zn-dependent protease
MRFTSFIRSLVLLAAAITLPVTAEAGLIRDAEIENTLHAYATPIFEAAHIPPEDVRIFIVSDPSINAYVAGGLNIFIHTGLIRQATKPGMLIGVIAHETGHIAGAHLSQFQEKSTRASIGALLGALAGVAVIGVAMIAQGHVGDSAGQAGIGVLAGSQSMAQRGFMSDIRLNEQSADHAALTFLDANDISATGMLEMFETLHRLESGLATQDPFMTDHPLTTERIATIRNHIAESKIPADQVPEGFPAMHARMLAKLVAFTEPYETTLNLYPPSDASIAGRYARAIAEFRRSHLDAALAGMDGLIKQHPKDPFFYDTKGQILF